MRLRLSDKQAEVWHALERPEVKEVFAGGAAGGGKSFLGCARQIYRRTKYAGTRGFIGRETYTALRDSTMKTYFALLSDWGYRAGDHYRYNAQEHIIYFNNGSEQHFRHMAYQPSDPDYNRFGSTEYTDGFVDEAPEVDPRACQVLLSRMRYKHTPTLTGELLYTGNPGDNWIKYAFVMDADGNFIDLPEHRQRVLFSIFDNPDEAFRSQYIQTLELLDHYDRQRLLYGDWNAKPDVERPFAHQFDEAKHVNKAAQLDAKKVVICSIDFNVSPFCATFSHVWKDGDGWHFHVFQEVEVENGSIEEMCNRIKAVAPSMQMLEITGDAMGNNRRVKVRDSDNLNLFVDIKNQLNLSKHQIKITRNPLHKTSRHNFNVMLREVDFCVNPKCRNCIRDLRFVEVDTDGKIKKSNRQQEAQQADMIDTLRYVENYYLAPFRKTRR
jgi:phage terminase large subunit